MIIHTVPMTMFATFATLVFITIACVTSDYAKYRPQVFNWISWWSLFLWMFTADMWLWYLVSISQ